MKINVTGNSSKTNADGNSLSVNKFAQKVDEAWLILEVNLYTAS